MKQYWRSVNVIKQVFFRLKLKSANHFKVGAELNALNKDDCTPLMLACAEGHTDVVKYLLHLGADMVLRGNDGMTCLHLAAQSGHLECVHAILTQNLFPRRMINETVIKKKFESSGDSISVGSLCLYLMYHVTFVTRHVTIQYPAIFCPKSPKIVFFINAMM